ncbi:MAG: radical SAM family heme chaperone HemW [Clostridia bacterium]|nr:radical SAM family heme chaperone HemW [Clostridia bacterium]
MQDIGLYIHIPFCLQKCAYCDFLSFGDHTQKETYMKALYKELSSLQDLCKDKTVSTVYIGGGTPTVLETSELEQLLEAVHAFPLTPDAEITVEANPETVSLPKMRALKKGGVNRISLGVQAMDDEILQKINRPHNVLKVLESYAALTIAGFTNISYDLIFNLPDQSQECFLNGLQMLLKLNPKHISLYSLQLEEGTPLFEKQDSYLFLEEDAERETYHKARAILAENGIFQYETSNFSLPGFESKHNNRYWEGKEYLGAGLGASSYFEGVRYENPLDFDAYFAHCEHFFPLHTKGTPLSDAERQSEFFFLGLRKTKGVSLSDFEKRFGQSAESVYGNAIEKHLKNGLLEQTDDNLRLTEKGIDLANQVFQDFI